MDPNDVLAALKQIDPIQLAELIARANKSLSDSDSLRQQVVSVARQAADAATAWLALRATATTADGQKVFDSRLQAAVAAAAGAVKLTPEQKAIIIPFVQSLLG